MCVIGAGQSGLALGFYLRRLNLRAGAAPLSFVLLDDRASPGGAWSEGWDSLTLFSPAAYSSLAGWPMPTWPHEGNPTARHVVSYLRDYETRYDLPVRRPHRVTRVHEDRHHPGRLEVVTEAGHVWRARTVVNATGSWSRPFWPRVPGTESFVGHQVHTVDYDSASSLPGRRVLVVGGGNSGAQVAADLLLHSDKEVTWATRVPPRLLPDEVDGRVLFEVATQSVAGGAGVAALGDIVATPAVRAARDGRGLRAIEMPRRVTSTGAEWPDGTARRFDTIVWCTGFRPALRHLRPLGLDTHSGRPATAHPRSGDDDASAATAAASDDRVYFLGYGDWCAPASATLIGVNRAARDTAAEIGARLGRRHPSDRPPGLLARRGDLRVST